MPTASPNAYAASATHNIRSDSTLSIAKPSDVAIGDLMVACIGIATSNGTVTPPAGWTLHAHHSTSDWVIHAIFYRVATSDDNGSPSYAFTCTGGPYTEGVIFRVTDFNPSTPMDTPYTFATGMSGSTRPNAGITTTEDYTLLVYFCGGADTITAAPSGMTEVYRSGGFGIWVEDRASAGATGSRTSSQTSSFWAATTFAIRGAGSASRPLFRQPRRFITARR